MNIARARVSRMWRAFPWAHSPLRETEIPCIVAASWGTSDFFSVMGTAPFLGRVFTADEQQQGHSQVAVLSHRLWQSRFGSSREIIGKSDSPERSKQHGRRGDAADLQFSEQRRGRMAAASHRSGKRQSRQPLPQPRRGPQAANNAEPGQIRNGYHSGSNYAEISQILRRCRRPWRQPYSLTRADGGKPAPNRAGPDGRSGLHAADCLYQRGQLASGSWRRSQAGDRHQNCPRCDPLADPLSGSDRKPGSVSGWRRPRAGACARSA